MTSSGGATGLGKNRNEHFSRIVGYGAIVLLLGILWLSYTDLSRTGWSKATGDTLAVVVVVIVATDLIALTVLSWLHTDEETCGQTLLALIRFWPVFVLCVPSLLGFALVRFSVSLLDRYHLGDVCLTWFLFVAPVTTLTACVELVRRRRAGRAALLPALVSCALLFASVLANLIAIFILVSQGMSG